MRTHIRNPGWILTFVHSNHLRIYKHVCITRLRQMFASLAIFAQRIDCATRVKILRDVVHTEKPHYCNGVQAQRLIAADAAAIVAHICESGAAGLSGRLSDRKGSPVHHGGVIGGICARIAHKRCRAS